MNYWHMQLEPGENRLGADKVKEIIQNNIIGMGTWDEKSNQQNDFQKRMQIGDVVLIKSGQDVIALTKVVGDYYEKDDQDFWFNRRRAVDVLEIADETKPDFPQPMGTLNIASGKNTETYKYIDSWYCSVEKKRQKMSLESLRLLQHKFQDMKEDESVLFSTINSIEKKKIQQLLYIYEAFNDIENKPVVLLRKRIIKYLLKHDINSDVVNTLKKEIELNFERDVFRSWKDPFRILYSIYFAFYKEEVENYLERFAKIIQKRLKIEAFTKHNKPVHFDGAQNQGNDMVWFAIFNSTYKSQQHAYQLFFFIKNSRFGYGLLHRDHEDENLIIKTDKLSFKDMITTFKQHIEIIEKDNSKEKAMITDKIDLLKYRKQMILQGPPGTGKTRLAKQIARYMVKGDSEPRVDDIKDQVKLLQFHPSYSYEDFVRGIVAKSNGNTIEYKTENKILANMAKKALGDKENPYILIVDEINRANLSSVLGELIYALEYRDKAVDSMYDIDGKREIILPSNLYIIGTMNTADRSIGHIDYAIRRRFAFVDILPDETIANDNSKFKAVEEIFTKHLSPEFQREKVMLGHSYFIADDEEELKSKLQYQVIPLLKEYMSDGVLFDSAKTEVEELLN
ncbi:AAA family ATPase [Campylobacterota bacterium]